jgi:hypothetical protein
MDDRYRPIDLQSWLRSCPPRWRLASDRNAPRGRRDEPYRRRTGHTAAIFCAGKLEVLPHHPEQRGFGCSIDACLFVIHGEGDRHDALPICNWSESIIVDILWEFIPEFDGAVVQAPNKYELAINLKTAKALGLSVPKSGH